MLSPVSVDGRFHVHPMLRLSKREEERALLVGVTCRPRQPHRSRAASCEWLLQSRMPITPSRGLRRAVRPKDSRLKAAWATQPLGRRRMLAAARHSSAGSLRRPVDQHAIFESAAPSARLCIPPPLLYNFFSDRHSGRTQATERTRTHRWLRI